MMGESFNFESKFREKGPVKMLRFQTTDDTDWILQEEWLFSQTKARTEIQRLIFTKENNYDRYYFINLEITSVKNRASGKIRITKRTNPTLTRIIIPLDQFKIFRYSVGNIYEINKVQVCDRVLTDEFRYKVTIQRAYVLENGDGVCIPPRDKVMIFSDQIHSLLEAGNFSDIVITDGRFQLRAHRNILSARSQYFKHMFRNDMCESREGIIHIPDVDIRVLQEMLSFMYSGVLRPIDVPTAYELFKAANKYQVDQLKYMCSDMMKRHMSVDNVIGILLLAEHYTEVRLKMACLNFVKVNFDDVQDSEAYNRLQIDNRELFCEINTFIAADTEPEAESS